MLHYKSALFALWSYSEENEKFLFHFPPKLVITLLEKIRVNPAFSFEVQLEILHQKGHFVILTVERVQIGKLQSRAQYQANELVETIALLTLE